MKLHLVNFSNGTGKIRFFRGNIPLIRSKTKFSPKILTKIKKNSLAALAVLIFLSYKLEPSQIRTEKEEKEREKRGKRGKKRKKRGKKEKKREKGKKKVL